MLMSLIIRNGGGAHSLTTDSQVAQVSNGRWIWWDGDELGCCTVFVVLFLVRQYKCGSALSRTHF